MLPVYNNDDTWFSGELGSEVNEELDVEGERGSSFMHTPVEANIWMSLYCYPNKHRAN